MYIIIPWRSTIALKVEHQNTHLGTSNKTTIRKLAKYLLLFTLIFSSVDQCFFFNFCHQNSKYRTNKVFEALSFQVFLYLNSTFSLNYTLQQKSAVRQHVGPCNVMPLFSIDLQRPDLKQFELKLVHMSLHLNLFSQFL